MASAKTIISIDNSAQCKRTMARCCFMLAMETLGRAANIAVMTCFSDLDVPRREHIWGRSVATCCARATARYPWRIPSSRVIYLKWWSIFQLTTCSCPTHSVPHKERELWRSHWSIRQMELSSNVVVSRTNFLMTDIRWIRIFQTSHALNVPGTSFSVYNSHWQVSVENKGFVGMRMRALMSIEWFWENSRNFCKLHRYVPRSMLFELLIMIFLISKRVEHWSLCVWRVSTNERQDITNESLTNYSELK